MSNLIDSDFVALHGQHTLQHTDWMAVYTLAKNESVGEQIDTYGFEDFLGLMVYLFITTQSQAAREQLSHLLSKCGSAVVLPLLKILCRQDTFIAKEVPTLAQQSLSNMAPYPLAIGLHQILDLGVQENLKSAALQILKQVMCSCQPSVRLILSQLQLGASWQKDLLAEGTWEDEQPPSAQQRSDDFSVSHHTEDSAVLGISPILCV